mmetsp:Transcript_45149/g.116793  ORF Transcript_45149/g.116793 Transcript_45149/m.116793 type:complete len:144 (+) Transcript_45149:10-441(+)
MAAPAETTTQKARRLSLSSSDLEATSQHAAAKAAILQALKEQDQQHRNDKPIIQSNAPMAVKRANFEKKAVNTAFVRNQTSAHKSAMLTELQARKGTFARVCGRCDAQLLLTWHLPSTVLCRCCLEHFLQRRAGRVSKAVRSC